MRKLILLLLLPALSFAQMPLVIGSGGSGLWAVPVNLKAVALINTATVTLTADSILTDDGTTPILLRGTSYVADMSVAGPAANGRDQAGAFTVSTWIYLHTIWGTGSTAAGLWSASATAPTLPTGYSHFALMAAAYTKSSGVALAHSFTVSSYGTAYHDAAGSDSAGLRALNAGAATTMTSVSLSALVPPIARSVSLTATAGSSGAVLASNIGCDGVSYDYTVSGGTGGFTTNVAMTLPTAQTVYYAETALATLSLWVNGWSF